MPPRPNAASLTTDYLADLDADGANESCPSHAADCRREAAALRAAEAVTISEFGIPTPTQKRSRSPMTDRGPATEEHTTDKFRSAFAEARNAVDIANGEVQGVMDFSGVPADVLNALKEANAAMDKIYQQMDEALQSIGWAD